MGDIEVVVKESIDLINRECDNIRDIAKFIDTNDERSLENLHVDIIKDYREKFYAAYKFRNTYLSKLEKLKIKLKHNINATDEYIDSIIKRIKKNIDESFNIFESELIKKYKSKNASNLLIYNDGYKIEYRVKNIPYEIILFTIDESIKDAYYDPYSAPFSGEVEALHEDNEYSYAIYETRNYNCTDIVIDELDSFIDMLFNNMLKTQETRDEVYEDYYTDQIDLENKKNKKVPSTLENFMPHKWQLDAYDIWKKKINNYHGTFSVSTGAGKTLFSLYCLEQELKNNRDIITIIVVPTISIMHNWYLTLIKKFHVRKENIGRRGGGHGKLLWNDKKYIIYISNTAQKELKDYTLAFHQFCKETGRDNYQFYIFDECYHYATNNSLQMFDGMIQLKINEETGIDYYSMGLSATPERNDGMEKNFYNAVGSVVFKYNILDALADDVVSPFQIKNTYCKLLKREVKGIKKIDQKILGQRNKLSKLNIGSESIPVEQDELFSIAADNFLGCMYQVVGQNPKILGKIKRKKADFETKYGDAGKIKFEEWIDKSKDIKLKYVYIAQTIVGLINKKKQALFNAKHRKERCICIAKRHIGNKVIIFSEFIKSAEEVYEALVLEFGAEKVKKYYSLSQEEINEGVEAKSKREIENRKALESFKNGIANIIVTVKSFDEGVDVPHADVGIIYQGTAGKRQSIQRLGRIVRKSQNISNNIPILYYLYNSKYQDEFLKDYFEKPYLLYNTEVNEFDFIETDFKSIEEETIYLEQKLEEERIKYKNKIELYKEALSKYKVGVEKIDFKPSDAYNFAEYNKIK